MVHGEAAIGVLRVPIVLDDRECAAASAEGMKGGMDAEWLRSCESGGG